MLNCLKVSIEKDLRLSDLSRWIRVLKRDYSNGKTAENYNSNNEKSDEWNIFKVFASKKNSFLEWHRYDPFQVTTERLRMWKRRTEREAELMDQKYIKERHLILGNDLATAHFIVFRGGRVKFLHQSEWIHKNKDDDNFTGFPKIFTEGWLLEGVDASGLPLRYEAFQNLTGLYELKTLILRNCPNVDDWCVDRISGEFQDSLEHLDLSHCTRVTERCLSAIYRLKNLKMLKLDDVVKTRTFEYSCLLLEEAMPHLSIEGVTYVNQNDKT